MLLVLAHRAGEFAGIYDAEETARAVARAWQTTHTDATITVVECKAPMK